MNTPEQSSAAPGPGLRRTLLACLGLVLSGAAALLLIFNTEPGAEQETAVRQTASLVDVVRPETGNFRPLIEALGNVRPFRNIELRPQVSGAVVSMSTQLVPGGFVRAGEVLLRIEDADYRNQLLQRQSELQQAIAELEIEQGRQEMAERDYRQLQRDLDPDNRALVLRQPQLRSARARVQAAEAAEAQARLNLERTQVRAPFDAQVLERSVDLGSQVSPGEALARLAGVEHYWVEATVPLDKLRWLQFAAADEQGSPVSIRHRAAWPEGQVRSGYLEQLVGELEGGTRLARVLVTVPDPLGRIGPGQGLPPLIIGAFVEARIEGREITGALKLPRGAIREGDSVWLMREGALVIQPVDILFETAEFAYIEGGLRADDLVVISNLATVKEGLRLRLREGTAAPGAQAAGRP